MIKNLFFTFLLLSIFMKAHAHEALPVWQKNIIAQTETFFSDLAEKEFGKKFRTIIKDDTSISGAAEQTHTELVLKLTTGLLNSPRLGQDSLRMLICHELGHLFGGAPRKSAPFDWDGPIGQDGKSLLSSEGQSDYYAGAVCFRKLLALDSSQTPPPWTALIGPELTKKCAQSTDVNLCYRTALAGENFLNLVYDFDISTEKTDDSIAESIFYNIYPDRQCRLDTIINGAACNSTLSFALNEYDHSKNDCPESYAQRPKCWYVKQP